MKGIVLFLVAGFLGSCASRNTHATVPPFENLVGVRWAAEKEVIDKDVPSLGYHLNVITESYYSFETGNLTKEVACHFTSPITKTIIANVSVPIEYQGGLLEIQDAHYEKQQYKESLVSKISGKTARERTFYCTAEMERKSFNLTMTDGSLLLTPMDPPIKLHPYSDQ